METNCSLQLEDHVYCFQGRGRSDFDCSNILPVAEDNSLGWILRTCPFHSQLDVESPGKALLVVEDRSENLVLRVYSLYSHVGRPLRMDWGDADCPYGQLEEIGH